MEIITNYIDFNILAIILQLTQSSTTLRETFPGFPLVVKEVQVDGGSEFMGDFEQTCKYNNIKLLVVPHRSPKLNGNVERNNRTMQEEYYLQNYNNLKTDIYYLKIFAKQIQNHYNYVRLHRQLKFNNRLFSPMEYFILKKRTNVFNPNMKF